MLEDSPTANFIAGVITGIFIVPLCRWVFALWAYHREARLSEEAVDRLCSEDEEIEESISE